MNKCNTIPSGMVLPWHTGYRHSFTSSHRGSLGGRVLSTISWEVVCLTIVVIRDYDASMAGYRARLTRCRLCFDGVSQAACRGGSFAVESVAAFAWNGWQASSGISGNLGLEYAL